VPPAYYGTSSDGYAQILRQHGVNDAEIGTHAGLADTSLLLAVAPQMVRLERLRSGPKLGPADGVYGGDPRHSSVELGQLGVDAIVSRTIDDIRKETASR
jgi:creatinine amidohydrolase/Fe(II)-dependent formamide hydrolase-like protein